jgi:hypothetical protein
MSYLWTSQEIESLLGNTEAAAFFQVYVLTPVPKGSGEGSDRGVLRVRMPIADTLRRAGATDIASALAALAPACARLLAAREHRPQPSRDEKIIVAWNALAIDALAHSAEILQQPPYLKLAQQTAERLWKDAYHADTGELKHEIFRDRAQDQGYLDDYALLGIAFLSLADTTRETVWRDRAIQLATALQVRFFRDGTVATTAPATDLLIEPKDDGDNTMPSGISAAVELFARLSAITGQATYANAVRRAVSSLGSTLRDHPQGWANTVVAVTRYPPPASDEAQQRTVGGSLGGPPIVLSTAEHVHASGEARRALDHDEITVTLVVDKGYHVNANPASFDYLIPTRMSIKGVPDLLVRYPDANIIRPKFAPEGLKVYEGLVTLNVTAPKGTVVRGRPVVGDLRVQACNDEVCLPPATMPVKIEWGCQRTLLPLGERERLYPRR